MQLRQSHSAPFGALCAAFAAVVCLAPQSARGQAGRARVLQKLDVTASTQAAGTEDWVVDIAFAFPVRYVRHSPLRIGREIRIELDPRIGERTGAGATAREAMRSNPSDSTPAIEVVYEAAPRANHVLLIRLPEEFAFTAGQGDDIRSLRVRLTRAGTSDLALLRRWMDAAETALLKGELQKAIALYSKVLARPQNEFTAQAQEWIGVTYERNGQRAHAKAEYEAYLERFPEGEDAQRVRQRLESLVTAEEGPGRELRAPREKREESEFDWFGSLSTAYLRSEAFPDDIDSFVVNSLQVTDLYANGRWTTPRFLVEPRISGHQRFDWDDTSEAGESRISELQIEAEDRQLGLFGTVGRQSRAASGVLGRFDGGLVGLHANEEWIVQIVGGLPLDTSTSDQINTTEQMVGASVERLELWPGLDVELFTNLQWVDGLTDRAAIGTEVRYLDDTRSLFLVADYDVYFASLNTVTALGSWTVLPEVDLNFLAEYRNSPYLTLNNALQGQNDDSIDDLRDDFSRSEIKDLAKDRTPKQTTLSGGGTWRFGEHYRFSTDVTTSKLESSAASGGVPKSPATGWEVFTRAELSREDGFLDGDVTTIGFDVSDGDSFDRYGLFASGRYPVLSFLRLRPRVRVAYRDGDGNDDDFIFAPSLQAEFRQWDWVLDIEFGGERVDRFGQRSSEDEWGYFLDLGVRVDF